MKKPSWTFLLCLIALIFIGAIYTNCTGSGTATKSATIGGNPLTSLAVAQYLDHELSGSVENLKVCLKSLTLKSAGQPDTKVDFNSIQERAIDTGGTALEALSLPHGFYTEISMTLADLCGTGKSIEFENKEETYSTAEEVTLNYTGEVEINDSPRRILFYIQPIVAELSKTTADAQIPVRASAVPGTYSAYYFKAILASAPLAFWRLNETSGGTFSDTTGTHIGTIVGTPPVMGQPCNIAEDIKCKSVYFDGSAGAIDVGNDVSLNPTGDITLEAWSKGGSISGAGVVVVDGVVIGNFDSNSGGGYFLGSSRGIFKFCTTEDGINEFCVSVPDEQSTWHHWVGVYEPLGSRAFLYRDGVLVASDAIGNPVSVYPQLAPGNRTVIGNTPDLSSPFIGYIHDVSFYDRALSASEVADHYTASLIGP